ncbi:MAG: RsmD family RNA methyltransferase [Phycisphaeraceae bacterium]
MRIIAGELRGRRILGPRDASTTRPITDRVKTSLFDRLEHRGLLADAAVLDIFAGTGSLGLEALSRNARHATFVERDRDALGRLKRNLADLALADRAGVLRVDAGRPGWLDTLAEPALPARVAFMDPPYALLERAGGWDRMRPLLEALARVTEPGGVMIVRTVRQVDAAPVPGWTAPESHLHGSMKLHWYELAP